MLFTLTAVVLSQTPVHLQALVPTSGEGAQAILDGKNDTGWSPQGDADGEGVLLRFEGHALVKKVAARACAGVTLKVTPFVNGSSWASRSVSDQGADLITFSKPLKLRSLFLRLDGRLQGACLAEVSMAAEGPLLVRAPRAVKAKASASSVLAPQDAYHPGYLFDGRLDFGWVEGAKGPGVGESMTITFDEPMAVTAVELWNGYQRSDDHFVKNARAKRLSVARDGGKPEEFALKDAQGPQKLVLTAPTPTRALTLTLLEAYKGKKYEDLVLSELRVWDAQGPITIATPDLRERAAAMKAELGQGPLATFVDDSFRSVCAEEDKELKAKFRSNHSFVVYRYLDDGDGALQEVVDGTWIVKDPRTLEVFGRSHRSQTSYDPYASEATKEKTVIIGGPLKVTRVKDLEEAGYKDALARLRKGPLGWSLQCDEAADFAALTAANAFVVEGRAVSAVLRR